MGTIVHAHEDVHVFAETPIVCVQTEPKLRDPLRQPAKRRVHRVRLHLDLRSAVHEAAKLLREKESNQG